MTRTAHPRPAGPVAEPSGAAPATDRRGGRPVGRTTHPWAWWAWALGAAVTASFTTNPLLLVLIITAAVLVALARRSDAPWARSVSAYLVLAFTVIGFRVVLMALLGGSRDGLVLFTIPEVQLPAWTAGIRFGGPVTLNAVLAATYDGLRLGTIIVCIGAANALANPRQALKSVPAALNQLSVAVVIALSVAPQLVESLRRVRRARRLRGGTDRGWRVVVAVLVPVMADALDRSMGLATAMESRGYGRNLSTGSGDRHGRGWRWGASALLIAALVVLVLSSYALFAMPDARLWSLVGLVAGTLAALFGLHLSGRGQRISRYRPHPWRWQDTAVAVVGLLGVGVVGWLQVADPGAVHPAVRPLQWPALTPVMLVAVGLLAAPLLLTEPPPEATR